MDFEPDTKHYFKLLITEFEKRVLVDERYRTGALDHGLIHDQYNVAVDGFLRAVNAYETKNVKEADRLYYRGWISSYMTMTLGLERQKHYEKQQALGLKQQAKLEKEISRLTTVNAKLLEKLKTAIEKSRKKKT
jgi:hypothetical protein